MGVSQQGSKSHHIKRIFVTFAKTVLPLVCYPSLAQDACTIFTVPGTSDFDISSVPDPAQGYVMPADAVVSNIVYTRLPIFNAEDPKENNRLFQLVDFLHIDTQERVIEDQLLFKEGAPINNRLMEEAARELRQVNFLYDARIWPYRICGNQVDIEVVTREVWTITGGFSFTRSGGSDEDSISISDDNFLGRGETLAFSRTSSTDRDGFQAQYFDPSVAGSRYTLNLFHADNDDGGRDEVEIERPFFSLDTRHAWSLNWITDERSIDLYERGEEIAAFQSEAEDARIYYGFSEGWSSNSTARWFVGWQNHKEIFHPDPGEPLPAVFPTDREYNYPYIAYQSIHEDFIQTTNLNQIHRIEDFNLGQSWSATLGYASESYGSDLDRIVYGANYRDAWQWDHRLLQWNFSFNGLWQTDIHDYEDLLVESNLRYYDGLDKKNGTYLALDMRYTRNRPVDKQLLMGAEENLRGYPARYQDGDRSFVFSAEHRYYTDWHLFRLLRIGGAVFLDVGRAWFPSEENDNTTGILADAGFGLRIASSRAQTKRVLHIDVAFPFEKFDDVDSVQVLISGKQSF
jgi:hypothetical protein